MGRILKNIAAAMAGTTAGFVAHQMRNAPPAEDEPNAQLVVAAPLTNAAVAAGVGLLAGRRGPAVAFVTGLVISAVFGSLDDSVPAMGQWRDTALSKTRSSETSG